MTCVHRAWPIEPVVVAGADDGDGPRQQQPGDGPGVGALLAPLDGVEELLGLLEGEVEVDDAAVEVPLDRPPGPAEHRQHRPVVGQHLGREAGDAVGAGDRRQVLEQERGDALALVGVVDLERGVGVVAAGPALVAGPGDELALALDDEGDAVDEVDLGEVPEIGVAQVRLRREEAAVDALAGLAVVEGGERRGVVGPDRPHEGALAVAEHDGARPALDGIGGRGRGGGHASMMPRVAQGTDRGRCHRRRRIRHVLQLDLDDGARPRPRRAGAGRGGSGCGRRTAAPRPGPSPARRGCGPPAAGPQIRPTTMNAASRALPWPVAVT